MSAPGQWSTLAPCIEHNSPPFDADGLCWVFKLFKGRTRNPKELALYLAVHESTADRLFQQRKKVDISFTLENMRTRGLDYSKYTTPITVWVDSAYSTWGDDKFIDLDDMDSFILDDTTSLVVRFHVRETVNEGVVTAVPSPAIAVYVPEKISAPFNQLLLSARFSDIQFELRDSSALLLSPGYSDNRQGLLSPRNSADFATRDALRIDYVSPCVTPMPGNCCPRPLPYSQRPRLGSEPCDPPLSAGPRYHAHKAILMAVSPVFEAMFSNGMRETYEKVVEVWDVTPRAFERLLEYAYTRVCDLDSPSPVSAEEVVETLLCADQFEVSALRDICWRNLTKRISVETVWEIWSIAQDLEAVDQQRACRLFCSRNFTALCHNPSTMWAPAHLLRQVLASDTLNVISEELLFETVVKWANFREDQDDCSRAGTNSSLSHVLSAERHITRPASSANATDEAVLKCYRSPSNLSLLPPASSPFAGHRYRSGNSRRKPELTREAFTNALQLSSTSIPSPANSSPRFSISATKLRSPRDSAAESPASVNSSAWGRMFDRKQFLNSLLPCIRFPMMDKNFLLRVVERDTDLMALPMMKDLLIEAYRFHAFNPPPAPLVSAALRDGNRRSSECYAKREYAANSSAMPTPVVYAKIILPLNTTDELTLSRSQRRKHHNTQKIDIQAVNF